MWNQATGAILDPLFCIGKITAALVPQSIEWAIAKQAAEAFCIAALMAGEIFTCAVLKEIVVCHSLTPLI